MENLLSQGTAALLAYLEHCGDDITDDTCLLYTTNILSSSSIDLAHYGSGHKAFFGIDNLRLPNAKALDYRPVTGSFWFLDCTIKGNYGNTVDANMTLIDSCSYTNFTPINHRVKTVCPYSFKLYLDSRTRADQPNSILRVRPRTELMEQLKETVSNTLHIDFVEFVKLQDDVEIMYNNKDTTYYVKGNVVLVGPYIYDFPDRVVIDGDLHVFDNFGQEWPDSLKVNGVPQVYDYYC